MKGVSEFKQYNASPLVYFGYIVVPEDVERADFIERCYRRERVSILVERGGGVINDCYIDKHVLQNIEFPEERGKVGTPVVYVSIAALNHPIIIAAISAENDTQLLSKNIFEFKKGSGNNSAVVTVDGTNGGVNLTGINGGVNLKSSNSDILLKSIDGSVNLDSDNDLNIQATSNINITSQNDEQSKQTKIELTEQSFNIDDKHNSISSSGSEINITPEAKLSMFNGSNPLVLGNNNTAILTSIQALLLAFNTSLTTYASTQNIVAVSTPIFAPLIPGYTALITAMSTMLATINNLVMQIQINNSTKSFTD